MRSTLLFAILLAACGRELPTEPAHVTTTSGSAAQSFNDGGAILIPQQLVLVRGQHIAARAELRFPPALAPWTIASADPAIASASGAIPVGGTSTPVTIEAKSPGETLIYYTVPNFGRAPSSYPIGVVLVLEQHSKKRTVRN